MLAILASGSTAWRWRRASSSRSWPSRWSLPQPRALHPRSRSLHPARTSSKVTRIHSPWQLRFRPATLRASSSSVATTRARAARAVTGPRSESIPRRRTQPLERGRRREPRAPGRGEQRHRYGQRHPERDDRPNGPDRVSDRAGRRRLRGGDGNLTATASDSGSGIDSVVFQRRPGSGGSWTAVASDSSPPYTMGWDTGALADGDYDLLVVASDLAGNSAGSALRSTTVDNTLRVARPSLPGRLRRRRRDRRHTGQRHGRGLGVDASSGVLEEANLPADTGNLRLLRRLVGRFQSELGGIGHVRAVPLQRRRSAREPVRASRRRHRQGRPHAAHDCQPRPLRSQRGEQAVLRPGSRHLLLPAGGPGLVQAPRQPHRPPVRGRPRDLPQHRWPCQLDGHREVPTSPARARTPRRTTYGPTVPLLQARTVTGRNNANLAASTTITITADATEPTDGSISYPAGYDADGTVTITTTDGTDAGSGIDTAWTALERQTAPLTGGSCDTFGAWAEVASPNAVASGLCAQYRYRILDRVGNQAVCVGGVVKVDTVNPSAPDLTLAESSAFADVAGSGSEIFVNTDHPGASRSRRPRATLLRESPRSGSRADRRLDVAVRVDVRLRRSERPADRHRLRQRRQQRDCDLRGDAGHVRAHRGSVSYPDGYDADGTVTITTANGSDSGAGVAPTTGVLERQTALLTGGSAALSVPWVAATSPNAVASGLCAQYRYSVSDRVGNEAVHGPNGEVKVDKTSPSVPDLTLSEASPFAAVSGSEIFVNTAETGASTSRRRRATPRPGSRRSGSSGRATTRRHPSARPTTTAN